MHQFSAPAGAGTLVCSGCGDKHSRTRQRYCKTCHAAYMREWRKTHPMTLDQRRKDGVRSYANVYKKRGVLVQKPCACGSTQTEMHHPDYSQPLTVVWMCRPCHLALHMEEKREVREPVKQAA